MSDMNKHKVKLNYVYATGTLQLKRILKNNAINLIKLFLLNFFYNKDQFSLKSKYFLELIYNKLL